MTKFFKNFILFVSIILSFCASAQTTPGIDIGDNYIVFEAEVAGFPSGSWKQLTPSDPDYQKYVTSSAASGIEPVSQTYLQYIGPWQDPTGTSALAYTFVAPKTGDYQLAARLHQPLEAGEAGDASNDFFVKMAGNFESATSAFTKEELEVKQKFWGRGINLWGTAQYLIDIALPVYHFTQGEQYTLTLYGRSTKACIDYIILFDTELRLSVTGDLAENPELYRPGGWAALNHKVAKIVFDSSKTGIQQVGNSQALTYKIFPSTAVDKTITWTSSNESVATVDENGVVTGVSIGQATITATSNDGGASATNIVTVGRYIETFDNYTHPDFTLNNYVGDNGNEWQMRAKSVTSFGSTNAIQINRGTVGVKGVDIPGGISSFSIKIKHLFQTTLPHITTLMINGVEVGSIERTQTGAYDFIVENIDVPGNFTLQLKNASGEGTTQSFATMYDDLSWTPFSATASTKDVNKTSLKVYPNPTSSGNIFISSLEDLGHISAINIYDISGRALPLGNFQRTNNSQLSIDVNHLNSGMYFMHIKGESTVYSSQFLVNK